MIIFVKLLLAHLIGDFMLQSKSWIEDKTKNKGKSSKLYLHVLIHGALVMLLFFDLSYWPLALGITIPHFFIDWAKLSFQKPTNKTFWFIFDQFLHLLVIAIVTLIWIYPDTSWLAFLQSIRFWSYMTALVFLVFAVSIIMNVLLYKWSKQIMDEEDQSLPNAGKYIGILERLLVFVFIITDHWEAVGFLITAKSVFRFGDLKESKDRKLTEYILIGTLLSFGFAILTSLAFQYLTKFF
ncbi:DUF3307 domain-containing protein [Aquiflexum lacus]|uniref:DUF3307 domain-containing protein n=1 Tax=Aquiflexum lacus TaxID=2483805 RepID=UPI00189346D9|nr:DUF3307 domain-containing protein [Aquiflexum lacus]